MTAAEHSAIMDKAIRRALANGWQIPFEEPITSITVDTQDVGNVSQLQPYVRIELEGDSDYCIGWQGVLFDRDFAKAIWGKQIHWVRKDGQPREGWGTEDKHEDLMQEFYDDDEMWRYHLQQMVVADDPIAYLGEHL